MCKPIDDELKLLRSGQGCYFLCKTFVSMVPGTPLFSVICTVLCQRSIRLGYTRPEGYSYDKVDLLLGRLKFRFLMGKQFKCVYSVGIN